MANLNEIYKEWLIEERKSATLFPCIKFKSFISRSYGRGRPRKYPKTIELISFGNGRYHVAIPRLIDQYVNEVLEGIVVPVNMNPLDFLLEELRKYAKHNN